MRRELTSRRTSRRTPDLAGSCPVCGNTGMSHVPDCLSPGVRVPCWLCGDLLHRAINERTDEFTWADEAGSIAGTDSDLRQLGQFGGAYAYLAWLADEMDRLSKLSRKRKDGCHWPDEPARLTYHARGREYAALKVRLELGGTFHIHHVRASDSPPYRGPAVSCCEYPAWLRPSGWWCRRCGQPLQAAPLG